MAVEGPRCAAAAGASQGGWDQPSRACSARGTCKGDRERDTLVADRPRQARGVDSMHCQIGPGTRTLSVAGCQICDVLCTISVIAAEVPAAGLVPTCFIKSCTERCCSLGAHAGAHS